MTTPTGARNVRQAEEALAAVERFNRAFDAHDVPAVMAAMTPDCVFEDTQPPDGRRHTGAEVRAAWEVFFRANPTARFIVEDRFATGARVVQQWRYEFAGGHVRGIDVFRVRDGRVAEKVSYVKG